MIRIVLLLLLVQPLAMAGVLQSAAAYTNGPFVAFVGDSIVAGYPNYHPASDGGPSGTTNANLSSELLTYSGGVIVTTNLGVSGRRWSQLPPDVTNALSMRPRYVFVRCGVNDIAVLNTWSADVLPYLNLVRTACANSNALLVIQDILPWTDATDANALTTRTWNSNFTAWAATSTVRRVQDHDWYGTNRVSTGYTDDLIPAYDSDGVHLTTNAYPFWARTAYTNLDNWTTHYVRAGATGDGTGTTWANAVTTLAGPWYRGDRYFIAGGTYTATAITSALSGTNRVTIKKANSADNSSDTGWDASYASAVALINGAWSLNSGYLDVLGVTGSGTSGHGIVVSNSAISSVITLAADTSFYTLSGMEIKGPGFAASSNSCDGIYWNNATSHKGLVISNCWVHEVTRNGLTLGSVSGTSYDDPAILWDSNVLSETGGVLDPEQHGQGFQIAPTATSKWLVIRNSTFRNIVGSAMLGYLGGGASHSESRIYNNVFCLTDNGAYSGLSPGIIWAHDSSKDATNFFVANNTVYSVGNATNTVSLAQFALQSTNTTGNVLANNIWQSSYFSSANQGFGSVSNNAYYANTGAGVPIGTPGQVNGLATTFTSPTTGDFTLIAGGYAVGSGFDLSGTFTTDATGATRVAPWDIGAFEYFGAGGITATAGTVNVGTLIITP